MTTFDYVLGAICVCVLIYQIILMLRMQRTAVVRGKSINKKAVTLIILALLALALWRMEDIQNRWPVLLAIGGVCASFLLSGTALSKDGVFYGGRFMPYDRAEYYLVERADSDAPVLRLSRVTKEAIVQLTRSMWWSPPISARSPGPESLPKSWICRWPSWTSAGPSPMFPRS